MNDETKIKNIIIEEFLSNGLDPEEFYIFVCYLNVKTVGVVGDNRSYGKPVMIEVRNIYTEAIFQMPMNILANISTRITNEIDEPNKVVYDVTRFNGKTTVVEI